MKASAFRKTEMDPFERRLAGAKRDRLVIVCQLNKIGLKDQ